MDAQEQAQDLWLTFYELLPDGVYSDHAAKAEAKRFAIICVDKILSSAPTRPSFGADIYENEKQAVEYWQQVKQEIENI